MFPREKCIKGINLWVLIVEKKKSDVVDFLKINVKKEMFLNLSLNVKRI